MNVSHAARTVVVAVLVAVAASSCRYAAEPSRLHQNPRKGHRVPLQHKERLLTLDKSIEAAVFYVNHVQNRLPGGQLQIKVNLQNRDASHDLFIEWKAIFYDRNNFEIESSPWVAQHFPAKMVTTVAVNSVRSDASNFTVMLRRAATSTGGEYEVTR